MTRTVLFFAGACTVSFFLDFFQSSVISTRLFVGSSFSSSSFSSSSSSSSSSPRRHQPCVRRPTCSVHPDAFLFWRRFDLPSFSPRLLLGYPRYPVSKSKKHTPSGEDDTQGKKGRADDRWGEIIVAHPSCFRDGRKERAQEKRSVAWSDGKIRLSSPRCNSFLSLLIFRSVSSLFLYREIFFVPC